MLKTKKYSSIKKKQELNKEKQKQINCNIHLNKIVKINKSKMTFNQKINIYLR